MTTLAQRFASWMAEQDSPDTPATPAATVLVLRDGDAGPEVLMVQRNSEGTFASAWVFPGGKVDPEDHDGVDDIVEASRRAARREAIEEADVVVDASDMVAYSHWMPPAVIPRRFSTWFFVTLAPPGEAADVTIDGGEIVDHLWVRPADALDRHRRGEVALVPPTWVTLHHLARYHEAAAAVDAARKTQPRFYLTRRISVDPPTVAWHGDAGYESGDPDTPGPRHRLEMHDDGWVFADDQPV